MKECMAMILAGGQGSRLGALTKNIAKPAVSFGGKYKIIDFTLSNCTYSGIDTVGVLTQYRPLELNTYIGSGQPWDLDRNGGGVFVLPPYMKAESGEWYKGTANAIYQNIGFIEQFDPEYVLILSGDHIYKMDYSKMINEHKENKADVTIAVINVPLEEAPRFGIMEADDTGRIIDFKEKPAKPKSTLASMGVYVFSWRILKKYLIIDENNPASKNDFGANIIPSMLKSKERIFAHKFDGYWKDVGTISSLWEANMDLIKEPPLFDIRDHVFKIFSRNPVSPPHFVNHGAVIRKSWVTEGCTVYGRIERSVVFEGAYIGRNAHVCDSIIMPGVRISDDAVIKKTIIGNKAKIGRGVQIGVRDEADAYYSDLCSNGISLIAESITIDDGIIISSNSMVENDILNNQEIGNVKKIDRNIV